MSYSVEVIADSISTANRRITTMQLKYPRMIHQELLTHRAFSRNASSTRAIPTARMIEWIEQDPAMPVYWGRNRSGMQATEELTASEATQAGDTWLFARDQAVAHAKLLMLKHGVHKQISSRILEPFAHINVIVTATNFGNFFALRCHKAAMPEIQVLAVKMARAYRDSEPAVLGPGKWHMPYVTPSEMLSAEASPDGISRALSLSAARCARVSYRTFDGSAPDLNKDLELAATLESSGHWSPFEHQARAMRQEDSGCRSGNFVGWKQHRQMLLRSVHDKFDYATLDQFDGRDFIV